MALPPSGGVGSAAGVTSGGVRVTPGPVLKSAKSAKIHSTTQVPPGGGGGGRYQGRSPQGSGGGAKSSSAHSPHAFTSAGSPQHATPPGASSSSSSPERLPSISPIPFALADGDGTVDEQLRAAREEHRRLLEELRAVKEASRLHKGAPEGTEEKVLELVKNVERLEFEHNAVVDTVADKQEKISKLANRLDLDPLERVEDAEVVAVHQHSAAVLDERTRQAESDWDFVTTIEMPTLKRMVERTQKGLLDDIRKQTETSDELADVRDDINRIALYFVEVSALQRRSEVMLKETRETVEAESAKRKLMLEQRRKLVASIEKKRKEMEEAKARQMAALQSLQAERSKRLFQVKTKEFIEYTRRVVTDHKEGELRTLFAELFGMPEPPPPKEVVNALNNTGKKTEYLKAQIEELERKEHGLRAKQLPVLQATRDELSQRVNEPLSRADVVQDNIDEKMKGVRSTMRNLRSAETSLSIASTGIDELLRQSERLMASAMPPEEKADEPEEPPKEGLAAPTAAMKARLAAKAEEDSRKKEAKKSGLEKLKRGLAAVKGTKGLTKGGIAALTGAASIMLAKKHARVAEAEVSAGPQVVIEDLETRMDRLETLLAKALELMEGTSEEELRSRSASAMEMALERQDKNGGKTPFRRPWVFGSMFSDADNLADDADGDDVLLLARKAATRSKTPTSKSRSARQGRKTSTRSVTPVSRLPLQDTPTGRLRRPTSDTLEEPISRDAIKLSSEKAKKEHHRAQKRQAKHAH